MATKYIETEGYEKTEVSIYQTRYPTDVGGFALQLAAHFAIVAAQPDGEDSAGRAKMGLMHPGDVAQRACQVAEAMWAELNYRGWFIDLPDLRRRPEGGWKSEQPKTLPHRAAPAIRPNPEVPKENNLPNPDHTIT